MCHNDYISVFYRNLYGKVRGYLKTWCVVVAVAKWVYSRLIEYS